MKLTAKLMQAPVLGSTAQISLEATGDPLLLHAASSNAYLKKWQNWNVFNILQEQNVSGLGSQPQLSDQTLAGAVLRGLLQGQHEPRGD